MSGSISDTGTTGRRWRARWRDQTGRQRSRGFSYREDAERFLREIPVPDTTEVNPSGYYVYLLWAARGDSTPLYVGSSSNILARLGTHLGDNRKRSQIGWVTFFRCSSEGEMLRVEDDLIRSHWPAWNIQARSEDGDRNLRNPGAAPPLRGMTREEIRALPDMFGIATAARVLGIGAGSARALAREGSFPVPVAETSTGLKVSKKDMLAFLGTPEATS